MGWTDRSSGDRNDIFQKLFEESDYIQRNILLTLSADSAVERNELIRKSGADPALVLDRLTRMELDGFIGSDIFGRYILKV